MYRENPKTAGSGIICCIPQTGPCPHRCEDCFFQSGRSYLEPLAENLPNMPPPEMAHRHVVRVNDGNDSNVKHREVIAATRDYPQKFYNTSSAIALGGYPNPVVFTANSGAHTDTDAIHLAHLPPNLMFVRVRTNTWNIQKVVQPVVKHYTPLGVPVILTFMAYFDTKDTIPSRHIYNYRLRKRTLNEYWAITHEEWRQVTERYTDNPLVHSCGTEGVDGGSACKNCGNCLREYYATMERMAASPAAAGNGRQRGRASGAGGVDV